MARSMGIQDPYGILLNRVNDTIAIVGHPVIILSLIRNSC